MTKKKRAREATQNRHPNRQSYRAPRLLSSHIALRSVYPVFLDPRPEPRAVFRSLAVLIKALCSSRIKIDLLAFFLRTISMAWSFSETNTKGMNHCTTTPLAVSLDGSFLCFIERTCVDGAMISFANPVSQSSQSLRNHPCTIC